MKGGVASEQKTGPAKKVGSFFYVKQRKRQDCLGGDLI